jgi:hypothetical protein
MRSILSYSETSCSLVGLGFCRSAISTAFPKGVDDWARRTERLPRAYRNERNIWIADQAASDAAGARYSSTLVADVPNFTNTQATVQNDEVYAITAS